MLYVDESFSVMWREENLYFIRPPSRIMDISFNRQKCIEKICRKFPLKNIQVIFLMLLSEIETQALRYISSLLVSFKP
jgi:hypothetical protein